MISKRKSRGSSIDVGIKRLTTLRLFYSGLDGPLPNSSALIPLLKSQHLAKPSRPAVASIKAAELLSANLSRHVTPSWTLDTTPLAIELRC